MNGCFIFLQSRELRPCPQMFASLYSVQVLDDAVGGRKRLRSIQSSGKSQVESGQEEVEEQVFWKRARKEGDSEKRLICPALQKQSFYTECRRLGTFLHNLHILNVRHDSLKCCNLSSVKLLNCDSTGLQ